MATNDKTSIPGEAIPGQAIPGNKDQYITIGSGIDQSVVYSPEIAIEALNAGGIASGEAVPTDAFVALLIEYAGNINSDFATSGFYTQLNTEMFLSSITTQETIPSPVMETQLFGIPSIASQEAFETPSMAEVILTPSVPISYDVPAPNIGVVLTDTGIPTVDTTFGQSIMALTATSVHIYNQSFVSSAQVNVELLNSGNIDQEAYGLPDVIVSNLDLGINRFSHTFWLAIQQKEQYCYYQTSDGESAYRPFFVNLSNALMTWINESRNNEVKDFINSIYSYVTFHNLYGTDNSLVSQIHADNIFSITANDPNDNTVKSYITKIENEPNNYYADYTPPSTNTSTGTTTPASAPHIQNDTTLVSNAFTYEQNQVASLKSQMQEVTSDRLFDLLFDNIPQTHPLSKHDMGYYIFNTLNYKPYFNRFNLKIKLPSYI